MSDYWVSHKKYFCKYCEIYIADDVPSRRQHENGLRHKGNRDRYVRSLYKEGERKKKDLEEEKREMARIEKAAGAAYARDISSGHTLIASSSKSPQPERPSTSSPKKPERPTSPWANYTTAQSLGIKDPDEERRLAELERRKTQGLVGEWKVVVPPPPPSTGDEIGVKGEDSKEGVRSDGLPRRREAEASADDGDDGRQFKLRKRKLNAGLDDIWDPGDIPIKLKTKVKHDSPEVALDLPTAGALRSGSRDGSVNVPAGASGGTPDSGGEKPKWKPMGWKRATEPESSPSEMKVKTKDGDPDMKETVPFVVEDQPIKDENVVTVAMELPDQGLAPPPDDAPDTVRSKIKQEDSPSGISEFSPALFRKRKIPTGSRGKR